VPKHLTTAKKPSVTNLIRRARQPSAVLQPHPTNPLWRSRRRQIRHIGEDDTVLDPTLRSAAAWCLKPARWAARQETGQRIPPTRRPTAPPTKPRRQANPWELSAGGTEAHGTARAGWASGSPRKPPPTAKPKTGRDALSSPSAAPRGDCQSAHNHHNSRRLDQPQQQQTPSQAAPTARMAESASERELHAAWRFGRSPKRRSWLPTALLAAQSDPESLQIRLTPWRRLQRTPEGKYAVNLRIAKQKDRFSSGDLEIRAIPAIQVLTRGTSPATARSCPGSASHAVRIQASHWIGPCFGRSSPVQSGHQALLLAPLSRHSL